MGLASWRSSRSSSVRTSWPAGPTTVHPLPNTFYAKLDYGNLALLRRGARYLLDFALAAPLLILPAVGSLFVMRWMPAWIRVTLMVVMTQLVVVVYEGGDHFAMFRFLAPVIPLLSMLMVYAVVAVCRCARAWGSGSLPSSWPCPASSSG